MLGAGFGAGFGVGSARSADAARPAARTHSVSYKSVRILIDGRLCRGPDCARSRSWKGFRHHDFESAHRHDCQGGRHEHSGTGIRRQRREGACMRFGRIGAGAAAGDGCSPRVAGCAAFAGAVAQRPGQLLRGRQHAHDRRCLHRHHAGPQRPVDDQPDVRAVSEADPEQQPVSDRVRARLLPELQDLGDHTRRAHGLVRALRGRSIGQPRRPLREDGDAQGDRDQQGRRGDETAHGQTA